MNPRLEIIKDFLEIPEETDRVTLHYENHKSYVVFYVVDKSYSSEVPLETILSVISEYAEKNYTISRDDFVTPFDSDSHRKIVFLRFELPNPILQIGFEDSETINENCEEKVGNFFRKQLRVI